MPGIVRKLLIYAAVDGLVLQPIHPRGHRSNVLPASVKIAYGSIDIGSTSSSVAAEERDSGKSFETFGIVGILTVFGSSYLIAITRREQVAQINGRAVYVVTEVALTPLFSRAAATRSIAQTARASSRRAAEHDSSDSEADEPGYTGAAAAAASHDDVDDNEVDEGYPNPGRAESGHARKTSVAEDVISKRGGYGRFAQKWFSKNGWTTDRRRNLGLSTTEVRVDDGLAYGSGDGAPDALNDTDRARKSDRESRDLAESLLPKLLKTTSLLFGSSRSFFFSYDHDITRSFTNRQQNRGAADPFSYKDVDFLYFWNKNVAQPFISAGQTTVVLPLMQGFVGQREFVVEKHTMNVKGNGEEMEMIDMVSSGHISTGANPTTSPQWKEEGSMDNANNDAPREASDVRAETGANATETRDNQKCYLLTLISRRSVKRAGLRYLRRGVDEDGSCANSVETEQILSSADWNSREPCYSFLQIRGSIPLFFSQTPYAFKPVPQMQHSEDTNQRALVKHFTNLASRYGDVHVTSLVERHGNEKLIGEAYEKHVGQLNTETHPQEKRIGWEWFDFHSMCKGMKFENVSLLINILDPTLDSFSFSTQLNNTLTKKQTGVLRTNCMDCLDRTNVVQSACARRMLEVQLKIEGIDLSSQQDQTTQWFNTLWADNGDAISKQYASTAALKGDFTRTRKRNYKGALTDMGLSISRFYSGIVNDYFSQTAIDFLLGNVTSLVFTEFEARLSTSDPSISLSSMRQRAIDSSHRLVVADENEEFLGGWALLTPNAANTIKSMPFEECVLLLTDTALYACRFDWNMEKVTSFERIQLSLVTAVKVGTYITSTLSAAQTDEASNVGFVITYLANKDDGPRVNTRTVTSDPSSQPTSKTTADKTDASTTTTTTGSRQDADLLSGTATTSTSVSPSPAHSAPGSSFSLPSLIAGTGAVASATATARAHDLQRQQQQQQQQPRFLAFKALPARTAAASGQDEVSINESEQVDMIVSEIARSGVAAGAGAGPPEQQEEEEEVAPAGVDGPDDEDDVEDEQKGDGQVREVGAGQGADVLEAKKKKPGGGQQRQRQGRGRQREQERARQRERLQHASASDLVQRGDIISLADARRSTGYLEQLGHSLKKLVWA